MMVVVGLLFVIGYHYSIDCNDCTTVRITKTTGWCLYALLLLFTLLMRLE
jgi:hypothetical protein